MDMPGLREYCSKCRSSICINEECENNQYPEFENAIDMIIDSTCQSINDFSKSITSEMPYKAQYLLEEVIKKLQERV